MSFQSMLTYDRSAGGWLVLAVRLADGDWHSLQDLATSFAEQTDMTPETARTILGDAAREGYLHRRMRKRRRYYRVSPKGLADRPELRLH